MNDVQIPTDTAGTTTEGAAAQIVAPSPTNPINKALAAAKKAIDMLAGRKS